MSRLFYRLSSSTITFNPQTTVDQAIVISPDDKANAASEKVLWPKHGYNEQAVAVEELSYQDLATCKDAELAKRGSLLSPAEYLVGQVLINTHLSQRLAMQRFLAGLLLASWPSSESPKLRSALSSEFHSSCSSPLGPSFLNLTLKSTLASFINIGPSPASVEARNNCVTSQADAVRQETQNIECSNGPKELVNGFHLDRLLTTGIRRRLSECLVEMIYYEEILGTLPNFRI
ncbi:unnamed protein product [Protopolystoma xenopodis]|uniref:Uncharacterized protein n=1 Tax=Protopolystoma xenopodis TaxID=117903 RepID=A0A3S5FD24_9PLAT|nr:unnamed protein product [Protopolystoma xenopodis]